VLVPEGMAQVATAQGTAVSGPVVLAVGAECMKSKVLV